MARVDRRQASKLIARILFLALSMAVFHEAYAANTFVQTAANVASGSASSLSVTFPSNTVAGDLILVGFDYDANATPFSVMDSQGNAFTQVGAELISPAAVRSRVYYAKSIKGGAETVTVNLSAKSNYLELYVTEYFGVDQINPIDAQAGAAGNAGGVSSGIATTTAIGDMIYGFCVADYTSTAGSGFAARSTVNNNLVEDMTAGNPGSYAATGAANAGWTMHMVALKPAVPNPLPTLSTLSPSSAIAGAAAQTLTLNGTNFVSTSTVTYHGVAHTATFVSATQLTIPLSAGDQATAGIDPVVVTSPAPGGGASNALNFTVNNPVPALTSLSPSLAIVGVGAQTLTLNGANFVSTSTVTYNGVAHSATLVSATQLTILLSASDQSIVGTYPVIVTNPAPGGGAATALNFAVNNPVPMLTSLSPSSAIAGAAARTLTLNGTNFVSTSTVTYNGVGHSATLVSATQLTIQLSAGDQATAGNDAVVVTNPAPGGGAATALNFTVNNPVPTLTSLSPSSAIAGTGAQTLTLNGANFVSTSTVTYNGVAHTATLVSATQLTILLSAGDQAAAGSYPVVVTNPAPGGGAATAVSFAVNNPVPTLTNLSPTSTLAGAGVQTLTLNGTNFVSTSTVTFNGAAHVATFVGATQLTIQLSAGDQATAGNEAVVVANPAPGGGVATALNFTVNNPVPTLTSLSPSFAIAGAGAQTLTLNGANFVSTSTVTYNGVGHSATLVSATQLTILLSASDQSIVGTYPVIVTNPAPGGGATTAVSFAVNNPVPTLTSLSPSSALAGAAAQTLTLNGTNFVSSSTVTYNGVGHTATLVSATQLTILLSAGDQATAGSYPVVVTNPAPGGGASTALNFTIGITGAIVNFSPTSLTFVTQSVGVPSGVQAITLSNTGNGTLLITSLAVTGPNASDFAQTNTCGSSVSAGNNCTISVTFTPSAAGSRTAWVSVSDNATGSPQAVNLAGTAGQFMALDPTKTYLMNTVTNKPVFMTGEDGWALITQLSNADVDVYLADRASRGFNLIWVGAVDNIFQFNPPYNYYGNAPFDGADFTNEDPNYWAHVDYVLQRAAASGMTVMISPAFVGLNAASGYYTSYLNSSDAVMTAYGAFLGNRYKSYPNIIWVLGGDADPINTNMYGKLSDIANGIRSADTAHLMTAEAIRGESSLDAWSGPPSWLNLNWNYLTPTNIPSGAATNYSRSPWLPSLMGEDWYEGEHSLTEFQVRQEGYWAILSGATLGRVFGNFAIWPFSSPKITTSPWQNELGAAGSVGQSILGDLFRSREHWRLVPDINHTVLTAGYQSGSTLAVAARTSDGQSIIAYIPAQQTVTIDMSKVSGSSANAWWFNPQTASATLIGVYPTAGSQTFTPLDQNDWVLVVDDASASLPPPGVGTVTNPAVLVTNLTCSPTTLTSGATSTCTVILNQAAPSGGTAVTLTNTNPTALLVPASVTVPSGASMTTFSATAATLTASQTATVTATLGTSFASVSLTLSFVDTVPPVVSILSPVAGQMVSGTITLSASASDNVGVAWVQFKVDGTSVGPQISAAPYIYSLDSKTLANGAHTITAVASDISGNTATSATTGITVNNVSKPILFVQVAAQALSGSGNTFSVSFPSNTVAGDLILVGFDYDANATPSSVLDSQGNAFNQVGAELTSPVADRSRVYYAKSIKGGADTVTINLSGISSYMEVYLVEYSGVDQINPIDAQAGAAGNARGVSSGNATTTTAGDMIYGFCVADYTCTAGSGFAARSTLNNNLVEDMTAGNPGTYAATGTANAGWTMHMVALKKAP